MYQNLKHVTHTTIVQACTEFVALYAERLRAASVQVQGLPWGLQVELLFALCRRLKGFRV